jgi:hypothetical protein
VADFSFTPVFHHAPWQDNVDRCEAGGQNGFNVRFTTIENDLKSLSTVVGQIGTAVDTINTKITPPATTTLTVAPALLPIAGSGSWALSGSGNASAPNAAGSPAPSGTMALTLPNGVRLTAVRLRGTGVSPSGLFTGVLLTRTSLTDGGVANIAQYDTNAVPLGNTFTITTSINQVDLTNFRYAIQIASGSGAGLNNPVTIYAIQITYTTS